MKHILTKTEQATIALAKKLAKKLKGGDIILLEGELGAGKTVFVKGLARAFKIKQQIKSPTFVLMRVYELAKGLEHRAKSKNTKTLRPMLYAIRHLVHCDAYRIKDADELMEAGLADWLGQKHTLTVIEWGEKILPILKKFNPIRIKFKHGKKENERVITLQL